MYLPEGVDYGYKGGIPGLYDEKGRLVKKAEDLTAQQLSDFEKEYKRRRGSAQINVDKQVQELERKRQEEERNKQRSRQPAPAPAPGRQPAPAPAPGRQPAPAPAPGRQPAPAPAPAPSRQPAPPRAPATPAATPQSSALADYTKAAAAARKSGDPAEMAKVRDMGMEIWAKKYKTTLAPKVQPGQSGYETIQKTINPPAPAPAQAPVTRASVPLQNPTVSEPLPKPEDKPVKKTVNSSYEYDAYDLVLEYLFSSGQADTISEAHYVMMQMDAEHIQNIISEQMPVVAQRPQLSARAQALQSGGPSGGPRQLGGGAAAPMRDEPLW